MKILLLSPLPPPAGGIATWTKLYINSNEAKKNYVKLLDTAVKGNRIQNISKISFKDEIRRSVHNYRKIKKLLCQNDFDIVHFNISCSKLGMIRDYIYAKKIRKNVKKLIIHCHCDTAYMVKGRLSEFFFKKLCKLSSTILCLNKTSEVHINLLVGKSSIIMPNFIDINILKDSSDKAILEKINTVIYVGHVTETKGCADIIKVAKLLPEITFKLIGNLGNEIKEITCTGNVKFLGEISKENVIQEMRNADLLLFPSHTEGFPNVVLEAMACGLPIVATPVGAIPDMIEDKGGFLVPVGDVNGMINAINKLQDDALRMQISQWNKQKVVEYYTVEAVMKQIFDVYSR